MQIQLRMTFIVPFFFLINVYNVEGISAADWISDHLDDDS